MASVTGASLVLFFLTCAGGILLSAFFGRKRAPLVIAIAGTFSSLLMVLASATVLVTGQSYEASLWTLDGFGRLTLRLDALSSIFLLAAGIVYFSVSLFVRNFINDQLDDAYPTHRYGVLYFALMASVVLILVASDAPLFLISWECMSILCFLLLNYDLRGQSDKIAGYIMLAMSEAGFLAVVVAFLVLGRAAADLSFSALSAASAGLPPQALWGVFLLGFFGFGVKAGLVPVNFWLPRSYTAAPSIFIPVFAGVTLNLGFYGILRLNADLVHTGYGTGVLALVVGSITALVGILYATTDNDMKTMLAHSSIENAGIIVAGLGAFLIYRASRHPVAAAIALSAALYHMLNHSIYKALLFQGAAYVEAETGTRDMDQLGGLSRLLPGLSIIFLVGCLPISAVPPFNGFVSEWMTLQALLRSAVLSSTSIRIVFALCGAALALTAALAVTCFVKTYAMSFLGFRRGTWEPRLRARQILSGVSGRCLFAAGDPPDLYPSRAQPERGAAGRRQRHHFSGAAVFYGKCRKRPASAGIPPGLPQSRRSVGQRPASWPGSRNAAARHETEPGGFRHVALLQRHRSCGPAATGVVCRHPADAAARGGAARALGWWNSAASAADDLHRDGIFQSGARGLPGYLPAQHHGGYPSDGRGAFPHRHSPATRGNARGGPFVPGAGGRGHALDRRIPGGNASRPA
jgi:formate hydrogenlyase subunit 3/multisubunit Na+/H+ antiporter MnhD subunit